MPAISICIPASSPAADLEQTLDSLVVQRFLDYELVITDASGDDSVERVVTSFDFGGRLRYFRNAHAADQTLNRDEALRLAQSPMIKLLLPGDRLAHANALGRFVALLEEAPDALLGCAASQQDNGRVLPPPDVETQSKLKRLPETLLIEDIISSLSRTIHRRSAHLEFDPRLNDLAACDFYIRALRMAPRLATTDEVLVIIGTRDPIVDPMSRFKESLLIFEKAVHLLRHEPAFDRHFWKVMQELGFSTARQIGRSVQMSPSVEAYFTHLFAHPPRDGRTNLWSRILHPWRGARHSSSP